jgi:hypothetical protein
VCGGRDRPEERISTKEHKRIQKNTKENLCPLMMREKVCVMEQLNNHEQPKNKHTQQRVHNDFDGKN